MYTKSYSKVFFQQNSINKSSRKEAQAIFWSLGDDFWKQIIDGVYHEFGSKVFDEGLHQGVKEPGFMESLTQGCQFASVHLTEKLSLDFYKELHKTLCAHFKGKTTNTAMTAEETGVFRNEISVGCRLNLYFQLGNDQIREHYCLNELHFPWDDDEFMNTPEEERNQIYKNSLIKLIRGLTYKMRSERKWVSNWVLKFENDNHLSESIENQYKNENSAQCLEDWREHWQKKAIALNDYIQTISEELEIKEFVSFKAAIEHDTFNVYYQIDNQQELEEITQIFFDDYNNKMDEINRSLVLCNANDKNVIQDLIAKKVELIADLFQRLEWLHPFQDGQGRTDLVLLAKLLSEEGVHPAILKAPYTSTYSLLPEWQNYLQNGLKCWEDDLNMNQNIQTIPNFI